MPLDLPVNEAEQQLISLILLNSDNVNRCLARGLTPFDFHDESYRSAFIAACALVERGQEADWVSISDECKRRGLRMIDGAIMDCFSYSVPPSALDNMIWLVLDYARRRRAVAAMRDVAIQVQSGGLPDPIEMLECLAAIESRGKSIPDLEEAMLALYEDKVRADRHGGFTTPWPGLNRNLGATIKPSEVISIAARTSVGKTWIALYWMLDALAKLPADVGALFISLEMRAAEVWHRIMALVNDTNASQVYSELLEPGGAKHWEVMTKNVTASRIRVIDPHSCTISDVRRTITEFRKDTGLKPQIVAIDYLGQMAYEDARATEYTRVSRNARALKDVAKEHDVTLLVPTQLKRAERGKDRRGDGTTRPSLDDLRDSGAVEESMDRILGAWAPRGDDYLDGQVNLCWLKNRHGKAIDEIEARFTAGNRVRELGYLQAVGD